MASVTVNPPKTPVTKGSNGIAAATLPNVCKMPGPPAPFVPTPLPNIGKSGMKPQGYTTTVKVEGNAVAIQGASFGSMGDIASKGMGGGLISMNCEGPTKFLAPGSMDVKFEGKRVQLLGDQMLNNCGPAGSPANSATMSGTIQDPGNISELEEMLCEIWKECEDKVNAENNVKDPGIADCWDKSGGKEPLALKMGREKHACCKNSIEDKKGKAKKDVLPKVNTEQTAPLEGGGSVRLDVVVGAPPDNIYDFKFQCPRSNKPPKWPTYRHAGGGKQPAGTRPVANPAYDGLTQDKLIQEATGKDPVMINENVAPCKKGG
jgi:hypothetical protein